MSILGEKYDNLKVGTRLSLGFGVVLLLSLVVLISGLVGFRTIDDSNIKVQVTNELNAALAQARVLRTQFQFTHDYSVIEKNGVLVNKMGDILAQAKNLSWDKNTLDDVERIDQNLKVYSAAREAFITTSKKRDTAGLAISQDDSEKNTGNLPEPMAAGSRASF
ncbi:hypothetical protein OS21_26730 [Dickeya oryzae]